MNISKKAKASMALVAAAVIPLGLAAPAQATTVWHDGCELTANEPYFAGTFTPANVPEVYYEYDLFCLPSPNGAPFSVKVTTQTWEQDLTGRAGDVDADGVNNADEDRIGSGTTTESFTWLGGTVTGKFKGVLPRTDTDGNEEVWHKARFRVTNGVTGTWSAWDLSQASSPSIWW